jgi:hypothetical protein
MSALPSFARMTMWFTPSADPLLQLLLEAAKERAAGDEAQSDQAGKPRPSFTRERGSMAIGFPLSRE